MPLRSPAAGDVHAGLLADEEHILNRPSSRTTSRPNSKGSQLGSSSTLQAAASSALLTPGSSRVGSSLRLAEERGNGLSTRGKAGSGELDLPAASLSTSRSQATISFKGSKTVTRSPSSADSCFSTIAGDTLSPSSSWNGGVGSEDVSPRFQDGRRSPGDLANNGMSHPEFASSACRLGMLMARRQSCPESLCQMGQGQSRSPASLSPSGSPAHRMLTSGSPNRRGANRMARRASAPLLGFNNEPQKDIRCLAPDEKIFDLYLWSEVLQESGDGGKVVVCEPKGAEKKAGQKFVLKMQSKETLRKNCMADAFRNAQLRLLNMPPHPGVLTVHEVLEDSKFYYTLMEKGTTFFDGLVKEFSDGVMPPRAVKRLMQDILEAIEHVHQQGMLHRDIKPDNLVMRVVEDPSVPEGKARRVALIDFDHAELELDADGRVDDCWCGTYQYSAPETFLGRFSWSSDLYSVGVILYLLMAGKMPYDHPVYVDYWEHRKPAGAYHRMKETKVDWECSPWPEQPLCRDFCQSLMEFDPQMRCASAEQARKHEWFAPKK